MSLPERLDVRCISLDGLEAELSGNPHPDLVLSPLVAPTFDALDVAQRLAALRFRGIYRAVAPSIPDLRLIREEVAAVAPGLDFDVLVLPLRSH
nr:hypothetical protein [Rubellimicrobium sp. CFH 75288]